jgi:hypothetical protein
MSRLNFETFRHQLSRGNGVSDHGEVPVKNPDQELGHLRVPAWLPEHSGDFCVFHRDSKSSLIFYNVNQRKDEIITFNFFDDVFGGITTSTYDELTEWINEAPTGVPA